MSKRGLGRGFDSLIPTDVASELPKAVQPTTGESIQEVDPVAIVPNPHQPRQDFDAEELKGLADSIKQHGLLHPPVVQVAGEGRYELVAGERRVRAAKLAGLKKIPVIVRSYDEQQKLELALLENVQRSELNAIETAAAYRKLVDEFNLTLDQLAARMGKAKSTVANSLRLLQLPKDALQAVASGVISEAHGRAILAVSDPDKQAELLEQIIKQGWTVRQAEAFAQEERQASRGAKGGRKGAAGPANAPLARELEELLGTKVSLKPSGKGGKLVIDYRSSDELQRIIDIINQ